MWPPPLPISLVALIVGISRAKLDTVGMVLHAYDFIFYLGSWSTVSYLWHGAHMYVLALGAGILLLALIVWLAWRFDGTRICRRHAAAAIAVFVSLALAGSHIKGERPHTLFYWEGALCLLLLLLLVGDAGDAVARADRGGRAVVGGPAIRHAGSLPPAEEAAAHRPDPSGIDRAAVAVPVARARPRARRLLQIRDGKLRRLRVETYGGASWLTEFSILAGMSTQSFGGMRHFVQSLLAGKVRETVPEVLLRCGYRNVLFYPMLKNFVSNGRFYETIGLREIFDLRSAEGAQRRTSVTASTTPTRWTRWSGMSARRTSRSSPTSRPCRRTGPTASRSIRKSTCPAAHPARIPRCTNTCAASASPRWTTTILNSELKRRFPNEPILIMHYGDHHPDGDAHAARLRREQRGRGHPARHGLARNDHVLRCRCPELRSVHPLPQYDTLDVAYLGAVLLDQAASRCPKPGASGCG